MQISTFTWVITAILAGRALAMPRGGGGNAANNNDNANANGNSNGETISHCSAF